jgi:flagellar P-ring protein precursor FlgI
LKTKNVAAVMVTATLPPFARHGSQVDIAVSALGDAKSLLGGTLLVTPLLAADGEVYAVAQGSVTVGGFSAEGKSGTSITKGVPTGARIANGAIVEREIGFSLASQKKLTLSLRNPDLTTAKRIVEVINTYSKTNVAQSTDPSTIELAITKVQGVDPVQFLTNIEQLRITPDQIAKIVIDEQNGVIVMGANVQISTVAISHGSLTINISENKQVSQPNPLSTGGKTEKVDRSKIDVTEEGKKLGIVQNGATLQDLVNGLNALGIGPRDMITVLQAIKAAGALQADIEIMS